VVLRRSSLLSLNVGTAKYILKHDGIRGMYRGLGPTILGYLPTWAIYFSVYDGIKNHLVESDDEGRQGEHPFRESWGSHIFAAMSAGATGTIVTSPLWVIKTRFMTQPQNEVRYRHTLDAFVRIYQTEGTRAFYRGLLPSLMGVTHVAVQFPLYEHFKKWFAEREHTRVTELSSHAILLCSSISKMIASIVTYPHEVVRTRLQIQRRPIFLTSSSSSPQPPLRPSPYSHAPPTSSMSQDRQPPPPQSQQRPYRGMIRTTMKIVRDEGWKGLYKGLSINLVRTVPNSAVTLLTYELLMRQLARPKAPS